MKEDISCAFSPSHLIAGVALLLVGAIIGMFADPLLPAPLSNSQKGYQSGFDAAKKLVENSSVSNLFRTPDDVRILNGTVSALDGNKLTLRVQSMDPFADPALSIRTVDISASTVVTSLIMKAPSVFQAEMNTYNKNGVQSATTVPQPFKIVIKSVGDIKVGDSLVVTAAQNVKMLKEFAASGIQIQSQAPAK